MAVISNMTGSVSINVNVRENIFARKSNKHYIFRVCL